MTRAAAIVAAALAGPAAAEQVTPAALDALLPADVVILGEVHDNPVHHAHQARAVAALAPRALVFEMLTPRQALRVTPGLRGDAVALGRALEWEDSGWPDFALYHPIFEAAPEAAVFGGALPRDEVRRATDEGAAAVFGGAAPLFGLDLALPGDEAALRAEGQQAAHCDALPPDALPGMVEAQRLRDAAIARAVLAALEEAGPPVAVITGNGHARRDWGVPHALSVARPDLDVLAVGQFESEAGDAAAYDMWLVTDPVERADPCAAFR